MSVLEVVVLVVVLTMPLMVKMLVLEVEVLGGYVTASGQTISTTAFNITIGAGGIEIVVLKHLTYQGQAQ